MLLLGFTCGGTPREPGDAAAAVSETRCFDLRENSAEGIYDLKAIFQKGWMKKQTRIAR
jgi:hypothetical protein